MIKLSIQRFKEHSHLIFSERFRESWVSGWLLGANSVNYNLVFNSVFDNMVKIQIQITEGYFSFCFADFVSHQSSSDIQGPSLRSSIHLSIHPSIPLLAGVAHIETTRPTGSLSDVWTSSIRCIYYKTHPK